MKNNKKVVTCTCYKKDRKIVKAKFKHCYMAIANTNIISLQKRLALLPKPEMFS